jgi:hypothetical protein
LQVNISTEKVGGWRGTSLMKVANYFIY